MENFIQSWVKFMNIVKFLSYKYIYIHIYTKYMKVYIVLDIVICFKWASFTNICKNAQRYSYLEGKNR